jgi:hypothetical protein
MYSTTKVLSSEEANKILLSLTGSQEVSYQWWHTPNRAFGNCHPYCIPYNEVSAYLMQFSNQEGS